LSERTYDLVLFGATGFTGRLVAEQLAEHAPEAVRWAIAGRNREKLQRIRKELAEQWPQLASLPIEVADAQDAIALSELARSTKVVCTTVGPYLRYGMPLARACAEAGTHYCDLTGEVPFMRRSVHALDAIAKETGARIIHACGYDSIPSDLGMFYLQTELIARGHGPASSIQMFVGPGRGGVSGGTAASLLAAMAVDPQELREASHPRALNTPPGPKLKAEYDLRSTYKEPITGRWAYPFFMGAINTRVARRTAFLSGWGESFTYNECSVMRSRIGANVATGALGLLAYAASKDWGRSALERFVFPAPGDGPNEEARDNGFFKHIHVAELPSGPAPIYVRIVGRHDPGYGETSRMLSQAALALAIDDLPDAAGVLTPSTGIGLGLLERLRNVGMTWEVADTPKEGPPKF